MRLTRFVKIFFKYIKHIWYVSQFKHSIYVVHGTNSLQRHRVAKAKVTKTVKPK